MRSLRGAALTVVLVFVCALAVPLAQPATWLETYREPIARILRTAQADDSAWRRLAYLTDTFGSRLSGSPSLAAAIEWAIEEMGADGLERWSMARGDRRSRNTTLSVAIPSAVDELPPHLQRQENAEEVVLHRQDSGLSKSS